MTLPIITPDEARRRLADGSARTASAAGRIDSFTARWSGTGTDPIAGAASATGRN